MNFKQMLSVIFFLLPFNLQLFAVEDSELYIANGLRVSDLKLSAPEKEKVRLKSKTFNEWMLLTDSDDPKVAVPAANVLHAIASRGSISSPLRDKIGDDVKGFATKPKPLQRACAASLLGEAGSKTDNTIQKECIDILKTLSTDTDSQVRNKAIRSLSKIAEFAKRNAK